MKKVGIVVTVIFALLALVGSFAGATVALDITQPASSSHATVNFIVSQGDSTAMVADNLQKAGLIRNAQLFRLWAKYRHLDKGIEYGVYQLSPSMTMDAIISTLQTSKPAEQIVTVPDAKRVTEYPQYFTALQDFNAANFLQIVKTGKLMDGTPLSQTYWYVEPQMKNTYYALEGYLYPNTYYFNSNATEKDVITTMLNALGEQLCPGPASNPTAYIFDQAQCKAHAVTVGNGVNIFTSMENAYFTTDDKLALYDTLTLASITSREILSYKDAPGVASTYHNRFLAFKNKLPSGVSDDTAGFFGADPTVQYARDSLNPPTDGKWWGVLNGQASKIDCSNPYNTESPCNKGLPPGPIAAPLGSEILAAAAPKLPPAWPNFYFVSNTCGKIIYYTNGNDFNAHEAADQASGGCK